MSPRHLETVIFKLVRCFFTMRKEGARQTGSLDAPDRHPIEWVSSTGSAAILPVCPRLNAQRLSCAYGRKSTNKPFLTKHSPRPDQASGINTQVYFVLVQKCSCQPS